MSQEPRHIVILGGGFGGTYTALHLERQLRGIENVSVTLVNKQNFLLFTPMLHEVAASDLDATHIVNPLHKLLRRTKLFCGSVDAIDLDRRTVTVSHGLSDHSHDLAYDHLVLALGSVTNYFGSRSVETHALTMKSLDDALQLRSRMIALLEEADFECCASIRESLLTFVVAGGGFAGVETVAGINDFLRSSLPFYPNLKRSDLRIVLVSSSELLLPELSESLGRFTRTALEREGIEVHTQCKVKDATGDTITLTDGTVITSRSLVWTAGTACHPLVAGLACEKERGRIKVEETLSVPGFPGVWALGDCASIPDGKTGKTHPPTAQHAIREAKTLARNIAGALNGKPPTRFTFTTLGQLASIGRRCGVANILGMNFSGAFAWFLWRSIYLSKLPRMEKRVRVAIDWTLDLLFTKDIVQYLDIPSRSLTTDFAHEHTGSGDGPTRQSGEQSGIQTGTQPVVA